MQKNSGYSDRAHDRDMNEPAGQNVSRREQLLALLSDGEMHSGERLASQLNVTRAAVWKLIHGLKNMGIMIEAEHHGYRLPHAIDLFDAARLRELCAGYESRLQQIDCLFEVDSTNTHVTSHPVNQSGDAVLCVAEIQHSGRGRRGRSWVAPFGESICMSLGWLFDSLPPDFSSLSLVVGVALTRVLRAAGAHDIGVKWPNDLFWRGHKLAGVLIEMRGEPDGQAQMVIGIGVNHRLSELSRKQLLEQQLLVCDLHEILGEHSPGRNQLVAAITCELMSCLKQFEQSGFMSFMAEWQSYDVLVRSEVQVLQGEQCIVGVAEGVTLDGSLLLNTPHGIRRFNSGEVSLRARRD